MTVYIEVVILNNLFIDLLLGITTVVARRREIHKWRQFFAAAVGAGVAAAYVVLPAVSQMVIRALLAPFMVLIFDGVKRNKQGAKDYLLSLMLFTLLTFALGGTVSGMGNLLGVEPTKYIYLGLTAAGALIIVITVRTLVLRRASTARTVKTVTVGFKGKNLTMLALYDSGNALTDGVSGAPVVLLSENAEKNLSGLDCVNSSDYEGFITAKTVCGEKLLPLIRLDGISVDGKAKSAYAALSKQKFDGFDLILQNTMFGGKV